MAGIFDKQGRTRRAPAPRRPRSQVAGLGSTALAQLSSGAPITAVSQSLPLELTQLPFGVPDPRTAQLQQHLNYFLEYFGNVPLVVNGVLDEKTCGAMLALDLMSPAYRAANQAALDAAGLLRYDEQHAGYSVTFGTNCTSFEDPAIGRGPGIPPWAAPASASLISAAPPPSAPSINALLHPAILAGSAQTPPSIPTLPGLPPVLPAPTPTPLPALPPVPWAPTLPSAPTLPAPTPAPAPAPQLSAREGGDARMILAGTLLAAGFAAAAIMVARSSTTKRKRKS